MKSDENQYLNLSLETRKIETGFEFNPETAKCYADARNAILRQAQDKLPGCHEKLHVNRSDASEATMKP